LVEYQELEKIKNPKAEIPKKKNIESFAAYDMNFIVQWDKF
jgi:hypothetical protein